MSGEGAFGDGYVVERGDARYPARLEDLEHPPGRLYVRGCIEMLAGECLSIIGTRCPTPYGIAVTQLAARMAAARGIAVVSGGARGCDHAAGIEALERGGRHVIVLGGGADVAYPRSSAALIERTVASGGAVLSLQPWGAPPRSFTFPRRNPVIAALSRATFIAEASIPSGTFSTAEAASQIGREVLAAPGSIFSPASRGANYLISVGACCIAGEKELEVALQRVYGALAHDDFQELPAPGGTARERRILRALTATPLPIEAIAPVAGCSVRSALEVMSQLIVTGLVERQRDGRYAASASALHAQTMMGHNREPDTQGKEGDHG